MLVMANLTNTKWCKKKWKKTETMANGHSSESTQRELSNEYQQDRAWMFFKSLLGPCPLEESMQPQMVIILAYERDGWGELMGTQAWRQVFRASIKAACQVKQDFSREMHLVLTLQMLRVLLPKAQGCKYFWKTSKPCHVGIHWIAIAECTHRWVLMWQEFSHFQVFCIIVYFAKSATTSIRVKTYNINKIWLSLASIGVNMLRFRALDLSQKWKWAG